MIAKPTFFENYGYRCAQAAMKSALSCIITDRLSYERLDELTGRTRDKWTYLVQIAKALLQLGVKFEYYAKPADLEKILTIDIKQGVKEFCKGDDTVSQHTDEEAIKSSISQILKSQVCVDKEPTLDVLAESIVNGDTNICIIDNSIIFPSQSYSGHHVVTTWVGAFYVYYHDSGPKTAMPNRKVRKELFDEAWKRIQWFDYGLIIVKKQFILFPS